MSRTFWREWLHRTSASEAHGSASRREGGMQLGTPRGNGFEGFLARALAQSALAAIIQITGPGRRRPLSLGCPRHPSGRIPELMAEFWSEWRPRDT